MDKLRVLEVLNHTDFLGVKQSDNEYVYTCYHENLNFFIYYDNLKIVEAKRILDDYNIKNLEKQVRFDLKQVKDKYGKYYVINITSTKDLIPCWLLESIDNICNKILTYHFNS